ncbi:MAG: type II secretion system F family protein [Halobacteriales archaeon]|nr:type II secretion system F family protein [Halobacteriales archaeon]
MGTETESGTGHDGSPRGAKERFAEIIVLVSDFLRRIGRPWRRGTSRSVTDIGGPYGFVRGYFKSRPEKYANLRRHLNQARIGVPYDVYLSRAFGYSVMSAAFGVIAGVVTTYVMASSGALDGLRSPIPLSGSAASFATTYSTAIQATLISVSTALVFGVLAWTTLYYYPRLRANQRSRSINVMLPHAVVFMYALTRGGTSIIDAMRELARSEDVYGEVANEFETVVRDMDEFGTPLPTALSNARRTTPSENIKKFFDDLLSTIDSGGDITKFLHNEGERYFERAQDEQEEFVQNLGLLGEVYTTVFIAAPLLFLIILLVMSFIGASTLNAIGVVIYVGIPLGVVTFGLLLHLLSKPYSWDDEVVIATETEKEASTKARKSEAVRKDPRYRSYRRTKVLKSVRSFLRDPLDPIKRRPTLSLFISVPAALVTFVLVSESDVASTSEILTKPVWTTTVLVVLPVLVAVTPLSFFHEMKNQRIRGVVSRFPEKLSAVSNANEMGMSLTESFDHVSRRGEGGISEEFSRVSNDIRWKHDTSEALVDCANRLRVPQVSRSMNLLSKASRTTGELSRILEVAAQDTANEYRLRKKRAQEMSAYIAVIMISFFVYLGVVLMLDRFYLIPLYEAIPAQEPGSTPTGVGGGEVGSLTQIPIETYRTLFYHSALILAFGNGVLAGMMGENDLFAGLKYAIAFTVLTVAAFWVAT